VDELGHESGHVNLGNGYYASRSSAGRVTIGSKCPRSFGSEPNTAFISSAIRNATPYNPYKMLRGSAKWLSNQDAREGDQAPEADGFPNRRLRMILTDERISRK